MESGSMFMENTFLDDFRNGMKAGNYDYIDSYEYVITDKKNRIGISDVAEIFTQPGPKWFESLFALRNKIASLFGLKTEASILGENDNDRWEAGKQAGIFKVFGKTDTEIVFGEDDKHLDVRVDLLLGKNGQNEEEKKITVTTVVRLHNRLGKCYFFVIKPVHRTVVPMILKQKFRQLENK